MRDILLVGRVNCGCVKCGRCHYCKLCSADNQFGDEGWRVLAPVLQTLTRLTSLDLRGELGRMQGEGWAGSWVE